MEGTRYFAYGSNMNPDRVRQRGLRFHRCEAAALLGYTLLFDKVSAAHPTEAHANIGYAPAKRVEGVLYHLEGADEILKMDPFENAPINYGRDAVWVQTASGELAAWTYFANPAVIVPGLRPSKTYLAHLLRGEPYLSSAYWQWLSELETAEDS